MWATLKSLNPKIPSVALKTDEVRAILMSINMQITLGRNPDCTARFTDKVISGKHAVISRVPDPASFGSYMIFIEDFRLRLDGA